MKVIVKKDSTDIFLNLFEGSVLHDVKEVGTNYGGVFSSFMGSYYIEVPKKRCKKYKESKTLNGQISKWLNKKIKDESKT
jgi:hypothetical protein